MTEPIDQSTKDLIEKEAEDLSIGTGSLASHYRKGYVGGATVWAEKLKQEKKESYKTGWRDGYDDFKINDLKEQLKQERNKVIDECIDYFGEHYSEKGDDGSYETWTTFEVQKELEFLKDKSHE